MSKFTSTKRINTRWRNNDFIGGPGSSHTFADALHEEFLVDWAYQIQIGDIVITETPTTGNIQVATLTVGNIVLTGSATGNFGAGATVVQGTAPISVSTSSNTATVSIDQSALTAGAATTSEGTRTYVKNATASAMTKGQAVYINGATGTNVTIELATATSEAGSSKTLGLLYQDLAVNAFGWVVESGFLAGINTSAASAGQAVYLGNTPGSRVYGSPPAEPSNGVYLGVVARSNVNNGEILVKVQNGYEIDELHDVSAASPSDGDIIQYKNTSGLWTKQSLTQAGIAASAHTHAYQPAGTYVTSVAGTAPITASTTTAGAATVGVSTGTTSATVALGDHLHTGTYDPAGTAASAVSTHAAVTTSVHGITNTANLLTTSTAFANIANSTSTATTISSTTSTAPTDISGMTFTFTPTYDEDVFVQANLIFTQTVAPTATVDIISRFIVNGTIISPQGGFLRLTSGNSSPTGFTNSMAHTFTVASGVATTVKVAAYRSITNGTFGTSNISTFSILRVRA